ncbi:hypothetical protein N7462_002528 [Penicillium macrosclerotiorum]|uniref:uncharacterized protein n=1 Tax=Penicillium macrosclerotiorum TaxID=303699 RepID=UPI002547D05B|nr:uncharacterized protein N7462_002528 [Penicillium macrosclerotiorum]KAJ5693105.1 hypothetical protein N7462_002528 [Penicillium macrosclerotiorum]
MAATFTTVVVATATTIAAVTSPSSPLPTSHNETGRWDAVIAIVVVIVNSSKKDKEDKDKDKDKEYESFPVITEAEDLPFLSNGSLLPAESQAIEMKFVRYLPSARGWSLPDPHRSEDHGSVDTKEAKSLLKKVLGVTIDATFSA